MSRHHPAFIGCWWLGYLVLGIIILVAAVPMFLFPKHFEAYYRVYKNPRKQKEREQQLVRRHKGDAAETVLEQFKGS